MWVHEPEPRVGFIGEAIEFAVELRAKTLFFFRGDVAGHGDRRSVAAQDARKRKRKQRPIPTAELNTRSRRNRERRNRPFGEPRKTHHADLRNACRPGRAVGLNRDSGSLADHSNEGAQCARTTSRARSAWRHAITQVEQEASYELSVAAAAHRRADPLVAKQKAADQGVAMPHRTQMRPRSSIERGWPLGRNSPGRPECAEK